MKEQFRKMAKIVADWTGSATAFVLAFLCIVVWAATGPIFQYSENWQLVINTGTTIVTFLMVFLIQNAQNRDSQMIHIKLDELIRANHRARNAMINLDERSDAELAKLHDDFCSLKHEADTKLEQIGEVRKKRHSGNKPNKSTKQT